MAVSERMCPTEEYLDGLRTRTRQLLSLLLLEGAGGTHAAPIPLHAAAWGRQQRTLRLRTLRKRSSSSFFCHLHFVSVRIVSAHRLPRNTENQSRESVESAQPIFDLRLCNSRLSIRMCCQISSVAARSSPRMTASTSSPKLSSFFGPIPGIETSPRLSCGRCSAIAISVLSLKTT